MKFFTILPALVVVAAALPTNNVVKQEKELLADILEQYLGLAQTYHAEQEDTSYRQQQHEYVGRMMQGNNIRPKQLEVAKSELPEVRAHHVHKVKQTSVIQQQQESEFRLVYSLDMTDPDQNCPDSLELKMHGSRRLCGKKSVGGACDSITIPLDGQAYTQVRGKLQGLQFGTPDAFLSGGSNIDGIYVDGVSITYGQSPRKHVWSFGAGLHQYRAIANTCPGTGYGSPQPAFVSNDYYCTSGNPDPDGYELITYDIPLWSTMNGNCGHCNNVFEVPFFCTRLPQTSVDDLEIRVCCDEALANEDILLESIELYVM